MLSKIEDLLSEEGPRQRSVACLNKFLDMPTLARLWSVDRLHAENHGKHGSVAARLARLEEAVFRHSA